MKKEHFITLVVGVVSGLLFSLGMCMCLVEEWGMARSGVGFGGAGIIGFLITIIVYRKLSGKQPIKINAKLIGKILYGIFSSLVFGAGMCMTMAFEGLMLPGIIVGIVGIVLLLFLLPMCIGWKK